VIERLLEQLAELKAQIDLLNIDKRKCIDAVMTEQQRQEISDIEAEFGEKIEAATAMSTQIETDVKALIVEEGKSFKYAGLNAVFVPGKITWDAKSLDGYAMAHPELFAFRTEGKPFVQIRTVK
jgi:hypothetical protein